MEEPEGECHQEPPGSAVRNTAHMRLELDVRQRTECPARPMVPPPGLSQQCPSHLSSSEWETGAQRRGIRMFCVETETQLMLLDEKWGGGYTLSPGLATCPADQIPHGSIYN